MVHYELKEYCCPSYPVGSNIMSAIRYIDLVYDILFPKITTDVVVIWVRGSSGAILGALLAAKIGEKAFIAHVKKQGESSHSDGNHFYIPDGTKTHIILDDFLSSGATVNEIYKAANKYTRKIDYLILSMTQDGQIDFSPEHLICDSSFHRLKLKIEEPILDIKF